MNEERLLLEHDRFLTTLAAKIARRYGAEHLAEDLKQEGAMELLSVLRKNAPDSEADLLAIAAGAVKNKMLDYVAENALPLRMPPKRVRLLRQVAYLCSQADDPIAEIQSALSVSRRVALSLYEEFRAWLFPVPLDEGIASSALPEKSYEQKLLYAHLEELVAELSARERTVLTLHLGLGDAQPKTFTEIAVLLNYNDPSAAQKVFERAVKKMRGAFQSGEYGAWREAKEDIRIAKLSDEVQGKNSNMFMVQWFMLPRST